MIYFSLNRTYNHNVSKAGIFGQPINPHTNPCCDRATLSFTIFVVLQWLLS